MVGLPSCRSSPSCHPPGKAAHVTSSSGNPSYLLLARIFFCLWVALIFLTTTFKTRPAPFPKLLHLLSLISLGRLWPSSLHLCLLPPLVHHEQSTTKSSWLCFLSISQASLLLSFPMATDLVQATIISASGWFLGLWSGPCTPFSTQQPECPCVAHKTPGGQYFPRLLASIVAAVKSVVSLTRVPLKVNLAFLL